jgi:hypothetical protein
VSEAEKKEKRKADSVVHCMHVLYVCTYLAVHTVQNALSWNRVPRSAIAVLQLPYVCIVLLILGTAQPPFAIHVPSPSQPNPLIPPGRYLIYWNSTSNAMSAFTIAPSIAVIEFLPDHLPPQCVQTPTRPSYIEDGYSITRTDAPKDLGGRLRLNCARTTPELPASR